MKYNHFACWENHYNWLLRSSVFSFFSFGTLLPSLPFFLPLYPTLQFFNALKNSVNKAVNYLLNECGHFGKRERKEGKESNKKFFNNSSKKIAKKIIHFTLVFSLLSTLIALKKSCDFSEYLKSLSCNFFFFFLPLYLSNDVRGEEIW